MTAPPTILVTKHHSLSDAEDFTEGYRALKLGKVVGEPTAGWIVYTSNMPLIDGSVVRIPGTRVDDANGQKMEQAPRAVDVAVKRPIGESYSGKDSQLDAAVKELLTQLGGQKGTPKRLPSTASRTSRAATRFRSSTSSSPTAAAASPATAAPTAAFNG